MFIEASKHIFEGWGHLVPLVVCVCVCLGGIRGGRMGIAVTYIDEVGGTHRQCIYYVVPYTGLGILRHLTSLVLINPCIHQYDIKFSNLERNFMQPHASLLSPFFVHLFRSFYCYGFSEVNRCHLEEKINQHSVADSKKLDIKQHMEYMQSTHVPSIDDQCKFLNSISNIKAPTKRIFSKRFSNSSPGPPINNRSRLIWAYGHPDRENFIEECFTGPTLSVPPSSSVSRKQHHTSPAIDSTHPPQEHQDILSSEPQSSVSEGTITAALSSLDSHYNDSLEIEREVNNMQSDNLTIYQNYVQNLRSNPMSVCDIRYQSSLRNVYCLNDCDSHKGTFSLSDFVHCSEILTERGYIYICDCKIYKTLLDNARHSSDTSNLQYYDGVACVHVRFLREHSNSRQSPFWSKFQVNNIPLVQCVYSGHNNRKFSVVHKDAASKIHLYHKIGKLYTHKIGKFPRVPPDGRIRICLDPKDRNEAIKREHHVTHTLEEILPKLEGAKVLKYKA